MSVLRNDQRRKLLALSKEEILVNAFEAVDSAFGCYHERSHEIWIAEHDHHTKVQTRIAVLNSKIKKSGSLVPLLEAVDKSDKAMAINPNKATNTLWSHALAGMSGSYLNLTL